MGQPLNDDDLDALLFDNNVLNLDEEPDVELADLTLKQEAPEPLALAPAEVLQDIVELPNEVSYVTSLGSSYAPSRQATQRFRFASQLEMKTHPVRLAKRLMEHVDAQKPLSNPLDRALDDGALLNLVAALQQAEAHVLAGGEVALILSMPEETRALAEDDLVARHLNATPIDGMVFIRIAGDYTALRRNLLKRGLREGADYEFIETNSLMADERKMLKQFMTRKAGNLRVLRRLSRKQAKTG